MSYAGTWFAPGGQSYTAELIRDAGGCYLWAGDSSRELRFTLEQVVALADSVDVWLNPGMFSTAEEILAEEPRVAGIKAFREKRVFQNDGRKGPGGGNDFYESAVAKPEKVLEDFVWAINGGKGAEKVDGTEGSSRWYRNIFNF
jgi:iron complex transport system substrate-binding protein